MKWTLDSERIAINSLCDVAFRRTNDMLLELAKRIWISCKEILYEEKYIRCKII